MASQFPGESNARLLVADDDRLIVTTLACALRAHDFEVECAFDSATALESCLRLPPALAIIDYAMPGTNGVDLARQLAEHTTVPIIFISAYNEENVVRDAVA